jgi:hypothetical protein
MFKKKNETTLETIYKSIGKEVKKRPISAAIIIPARDPESGHDSMGMAYRLIVPQDDTPEGHRAMVLAKAAALFFAAGFEDVPNQIGCRFVDLRETEHFLSVCRFAIEKAANEVVEDYNNDPDADEDEPDDPPAEPPGK